MTLVPHSWTVKEIEDFFGVGNSIARKSKELMKEKGLVPEIAKKKGKVLVTNILKVFQIFIRVTSFQEIVLAKRSLSV